MSTTHNRPYGYYQNPMLAGEALFFISEGHIWRACLSNLDQAAHRVTATSGAVTSFVICADSDTIFYVSTSEGQQDLYRLSLQSGTHHRLTYLGGTLEVLGFCANGDIIVRSNHETAFDCLFKLYQIAPTTGAAVSLDTGPANFISFGKTHTALGRHGYGYISWKRYRGGTAGEVWVRKGKGDWYRLFESLKSNVLRPLCIEGRLYFLSDHDDIGSLYSSTFDGADIQRHTHFDDFCVRGISTDGARIVYQKGGDLWFFDPKNGENVCVSPPIVSAGVKRRRHFIDAAKHLSEHALSPSGRALCLTSRGRLMVGSPFKGAMVQLGLRHGVRYRLGQFLDEQKIVAVCDEGDAEDLHIFTVETLQKRVLKGDWGRIIQFEVSPKGDFVVVENHEHKLFHVDLKKGHLHLIDHSAFGVYNGISVSPDGGFVAYAIARSHKVYGIKIFDVKEKQSFEATRPTLRDICPVFDPKGRYLYFLSARVYGHDGMSGEDGLLYQPCLLTLCNETASPFIVPCESLETGSKKEDAPAALTGKIDVAGLTRRVLSFPMDLDAYVGVWAAGDKVFFWCDEHEEGAEHFQGSLITFDMSALKKDTFYEDVRDVSFAQGGEWLSLIDDDKKLRVVRVAEKPEEEDTSFRAGGWFDFDRARFEVEPILEWRFMLKEAWRLQKDLFWDPGLRDIDWRAVYMRYAPLVERVNTPSELMDVIGEMQGELGSSHAYTWGYDQGVGPDYRVGFLGATFAYKASSKQWILKAMQACVDEDEELRSPLQAPGVNMTEGDALLAVDGRVLSADFSPEEALMGKADRYVALQIRDAQTRKNRNVLVKPRARMRPLIYGAFVKANRDYVHASSNGDIGYIHIPDMAAQGFQEFYKAYVREFDRKALILDVRFNRGGMISSEILSQLLRKRLGYDQSRHEGRVPYMLDSPRGPMVALCNEYTASDGDMFAYSFQRLQMGPLIGKRTWGGVVGIFPKHPLLDGSWTSQPEYAIWFHDIGWRLENMGAEPDIVVDLPPGTSVGPEDPQLERGLIEARALIQKT